MRKGLPGALDNKNPLPSTKPPTPPLPRPPPCPPSLEEERSGAAANRGAWKKERPGERESGEAPGSERK